ncbi:retrotransposon-derived protein PEG10-like, partial [Trifolium medium]|nr:retrotransposon-derived protein PEG10-like [Trifolium medium]
RQFLLLLVDDAVLTDSDPTTEDLLDPGEGVTEDPPPTTDGEHFQLSTAALSGPPSPRTLRVEGRINELQVTILIDSGSSHNIMQPRVAEFLQLPIDAIPQFVVTVGNGQTIQ